jgi:hypothetical protein
LSDRLFRDTLDEGVDDVEIDVAFQQRSPDLAQSLVDIGFAQAAPAAELFERFAETFLNAFEHGCGLGVRIISNRYWTSFGPIIVRESTESSNGGRLVGQAHWMDCVPAE